MSPEEFDALCEEEKAYYSLGNNFISSVFSGNCDWCGTLSDGLRYHRDLDEGVAGPLYSVCPECIRKENEAAQAALTEMENCYDW